MVSFWCEIILLTRVTLHFIPSVNMKIYFLSQWTADQRKSASEAADLWCFCWCCSVAHHQSTLKLEGTSFHAFDQSSWLCANVNTQKHSPSLLTVDDKWSMENYDRNVGSAWKTWLVSDEANGNLSVYVKTNAGIWNGIPYIFLHLLFFFSSCFFFPFCAMNRRKSESACCSVLPWCGMNCRGRGRLLAGK